MNEVPGPEISTGLIIGIWIVSFLINLLIAFWAGKVGERNGRSFWLCALVGFFLGLIGVLIVYLMGPSYNTGGAYRNIPTDQYQQPPQYTGLPEPPPEFAEPPRTKVCTLCGKLVEGEATFCQYCGADISAEKPWK